MDSTKNKLIKIMEELNMEDEIACISSQSMKTTDEIVNVVTQNVPLNRNEYINNKIYEISSLKNQVLQHKQSVNDTFNVQYFRAIGSHRKVIGKVIVFYKKGIRKLLQFLIEPIVNEQTSFNHSVTMSINSLSEYMVKINEYSRSQSILNKELLNNQKMLSNILDHLEEKKEAKTDDLIVLKNKMNRIIAKYNEIENAFGKELGNAPIQENVESKTTLKEENTTIYEDISYFEFENAFRGSRESIRKSQMAYLEFFQEKEDVIDLGCGRGEFLDILRENNISAVGVDMYQEFVDFCNTKGNKAIYGDAIEYLHGLEDNTLGGIFSSQLIEHIENDKLVQLCKDAYNKLQDGAYLIMETPNPTCLATFRNGFYMDPSHFKPVHPKTLKFYLQKAGFKEIKIIFTESSKEGYRLPLLNGSGIYNLAEFNDGINNLSEILFGSQDYAIIAQK